MKAKRSSKMFAKVTLVLSVALLLVVATASPALADDDDPVIIDMVIAAEALEPYIGDGGMGIAPVEDPVFGDAGGWEMVPDDEPPITDGGDWEMVPREDPVFGDAGGSEMVPRDEPPFQDGGGDGVQDATETAEPPDDNQPQGGNEAPEAETPTETPEAQTGSDEPSLPFTGGNEAPYVLAGLALAVAAGGYLLRKRHVFSRH